MVTYERGLQERCIELLDRLRLPYRFGTDELIDAVAALRGKPIDLVPMEPPPPGVVVHGQLHQFEDLDVIMYEPATFQLHQLHSVSHEVGHLLFEHPDDPSLRAVAQEEARSQGRDPSKIIRVSGRTGYSSIHEVEAETLASLIRQRMYRSRLLPPPQPSGAAERWEAAFTRPIKERRR
ncbi:hypothetical protein ABH932_004583 [Streptacidiphilus sp. MAP5-52]